MLSQKVKQYFIDEKYVHLSEQERQEYIKVLLDFDIKLDSSFAEFNLLTVGPSFKGRMYSLYNICWFKIYSEDLDYGIEAASRMGIPSEYIPLDSFEGEGGFFYNRKTGEVLEIELGQKMDDFLSGKLRPQWATFNDFLEWYFELA